MFILLSASAHAFKHKLGLTDWLADWVSQHYLPPQTWSQNFIESHAHKWYFIVLKSLHYRSITKVALCLLCLLMLNEVTNLMHVHLLATDWIHSCIICQNSVGGRVMTIPSSNYFFCMGFKWCKNALKNFFSLWRGVLLTDSWPRNAIFTSNWAIQGENFMFSIRSQKMV